MTITTSLGTADGVRRILGRSSDELVDSEITPYLAEAFRKIKMKTYPKFMLDRVFANGVPRTGVVSRVYETYFNMKDATSDDVVVYIGGVLQTLTTNYTIDFAASTITITSNTELFVGSQILMIYLPDFYDDWANYIVAKRSMDTRLVDTSNSVSQNTVRNLIKETMKEYEDAIKSKPHMSTMVDHNEYRGASGGSIW